MDVQIALQEHINQVLDKHRVHSVVWGHMQQLVLPGALTAQQDILRTPFSRDLVCHVLVVKNPV